jgi:hypothetical protein
VGDGVGEQRREGVGKKGGQRKKINMVGPSFGGEMEGLQKWRLRGDIWRGMQNGGLFRGPAGDGFLHQTSKF